MKVGDLGAARILKSTDEQLVTKPVGTRDFMAPEIAKKKSYSTKADIWSAGVSVSQMLHGSGQQKVKGLSQHTCLSHGGNDDLAATNLAAMVADMLSEDPELRPSAQQILQRMTRDETMTGAC